MSNTERLTVTGTKNTHSLYIRVCYYEVSPETVSFNKMVAMAFLLSRYIHFAEINCFLFGTEYCHHLDILETLGTMTKSLLSQDFLQVDENHQQKVNQKLSHNAREKINWANRQSSKDRFRDNLKSRLTPG